MFGIERLQGKVAPTSAYDRPLPTPIGSLPASPSVEHRKHKGLNNRAENSHHPPPAFQRRRRWNLRWLRPRDNESGR